jgi:SAM-dependent methyltransferase
MGSYASVPYESLPVAESHPQTLQALAWLFGIDAAPPDRCRVLELGCASGGNLLPMAFYLPAGRFVGIDLYENQVAAGQARVAALGLGNIELRQGDIAALDPAALGTFDYVIAHGVYSWVPDAVRDKLLALARDVLAPSGIAFVSYNTLPGWRMRGMLRDLLLHAVRGHSEPAAKLRAARAALDRVAAAVRGLDALSARYLATEIARLGTKPDSYLFHEYLAEENRPLLFRDFVDRAAAAGLRHVCDTDLSSRYPAILGEATDAALADLSDPLEREQYLDFVVNRNFRRSLLCRSDAAAWTEPVLDRFDGLTLRSALAPPRKLDLRRAKPAPFTPPDGEPVEVFHPLTKAALVRLWELHPAGATTAALAAAVGPSVAQAGGAAAAGESDHLGSELYSLFLRGRIQASRGVVPPAARVAAVRPEVNALARLQASEGDGAVTGPWHTALLLDGALGRAVALMDGTRTVGEIAAELGIQLAPPSGPGEGGGRKGAGGTTGDLQQRVADLVRTCGREGLMDPPGR